MRGECSRKGDMILNLLKSNLLKTSHFPSTGRFAGVKTFALPRSAEGWCLLEREFLDLQSIDLA